MEEQRQSFRFHENARKNFGPFTDGFIKIAYDDIDALEATLKSSKILQGF
jgi:ornithine--oxo-acid transaminase